MARERERLLDKQLHPKALKQNPKKGERDNLLDEELFVELLDEVDLLGPVQLVLERLQHVASFNAEDFERDVT